MPQVSSELSLNDHLGACKARWGIGRMTYIVPPGLYAIGTPGATTPVVVTANYKMSYDIVRRNLAGRDVWLLVLETYGINVWCAAGKGTFGTGELVRRIESSGLSTIVSHRKLLLPILGAPGVSAHEVARRSGFKVQYAAIRADDIPEFLDNGFVTTSVMRQLTFTFYERLVLVPVELVMALKSALVIALCLYLLAYFTAGSLTGFKVVIAYLGALLTGVAVAPLLLPWLPGRSFSVKGAIVGFGWYVVWYLLTGASAWSFPAAFSALLALPAISSFYALNFTGCSPYTSRTGVKREMRRTLPTMGGALAASIIMMVIAWYYKGPL